MSCPCGICVPSNSTVSVTKRSNLDWLRPLDCGLAMYECRYVVPFWSSQYSILGLSVERLSASIQFSLFQVRVRSASSMSVKTCDHRTAPSSSWQPLCRRIFVNQIFEKSLNSQSLLCLLLLGLSYIRWLNPSETSFGFGTSLYFTGECSWWASSCCLLYLGNGNCCFLSSTVQTIMALLLENIGWAHSPWGPLRFPFHYVFSDAGPKKHQRLAWILSHMLPIPSHCIAFPCPINVVEHQHAHDTIFERFWISPVQIRLNMLLHAKSGSTW